MSEITEIKTLNGYPLADTKARADIATLSEEKVNRTGWSPGVNLGTDENGNVVEKADIFSKDTSNWKPVNMLEGVEWTELGYFWKTSNGTLITSSSTGSYRSCTEMIPIAPNCTYVATIFKGQIALYTESKTNGVLVTGSTITDPNTPVEFTSAADQVFMTISYQQTSETVKPERMTLTRTTISKAEYDNLPTKADSIKEMYGQTGVAFGDSLFGMYRGETSAPAYIANLTGATVHNVGCGGCRMSTHPYIGYNAFCMYALADAVASGDWTPQEAAVADGSGQAYFADQLALMKSIDFSKVDFAVIHYGTNDYTASVEIDNESNPQDTSTVCGALRYSIEKLLTAYPEMRLYISLPAFRFWEEEGVKTYPDTHTNVNGNSLIEFVEALREVAKDFNLPVIDSYYDLGINRYNCETFFTDGTHHNETGRKRFGTFIGSKILANR